MKEVTCCNWQFFAWELDGHVYQMGGPAFPAFVRAQAHGGYVSGSQDPPRELSWGTKDGRRSFGSAAESRAQAHNTARSATVSWNRLRWSGPCAREDLQVFMSGSGIRSLRWKWGESGFDQVSEKVALAHGWALSAKRAQLYLSEANLLQRPLCYFIPNAPNKLPGFRR